MIPDEPIVLTGAASGVASGVGDATARRLRDRGRTLGYGPSALRKGCFLPPLRIYASDRPASLKLM